MIVSALSQFLRFASHHPFQFLILLTITAVLLALSIKNKHSSNSGFALIPMAFGLGMANFMLAHWINALFINAVGVYGSAVIIDRRDANFTFNDRPVSHFDTLITTADGEEVLSSMTEISAATYPLRNSIRIPPMNQRFVVKYVPGDEANFAVMVDESDYGKRQLLREAREPVEYARRLYEASPNNPDFILKYRQALELFIEQQAGNAPAAQIARDREMLRELEQAGG